MASQFDSYFDEIDEFGKGYITIEDVRKIDTSLNYGLQLASNHFLFVLKECCKRPDAILKNEFPDVCPIPHGGVFIIYDQNLHVLQELQRRRKQEQDIHWDFKGLDSRDCGRLQISDVLLLFRLTLKDRYSRTIWHSFETALAGRDYATFDDVRYILCSKYPSGKPVKNTKAEEKVIKENINSNSKSIVENVIVKQENDSLSKKRRHDENEKTKRLAKRKLKKWTSEGIEALISDTGIDDGIDHATYMFQMGQPSVGDLIDVIDRKYDVIRRVLFWRMLKAEVGDIIWSSYSESEIIEKFDQLSLEEKELRNSGKLSSQGAMSLQGCRNAFPGTFHSLMGELDSSEADDLFLQRRRQLRSKFGDDNEVDLKHKNECLQDFNEENTLYIEMLITLAERQTEEKSDILDRLRADTNSAKRLNSVLRYYIIYNRQVIVGESIIIGDDAFEATILALGLTERKQIFKKGGRFDYDRIRQEKLAMLRLQKSGMKAPINVRISNSSKSHGSMIALKMSIIRALILKHIDERLAIIDLLHTTSVYKSGKTLTHEQRQIRITKLRASRTRWRQNTSEYLDAHRKTQLKMLIEGVGLCIEDIRQHDISVKKEIYSKKAMKYLLPDHELAAILLADLQQRQDEEIQQIIAELVSKSMTELNDLLTLTLQLRADGVNDNVASIVLGTLQFTLQEQPIITAMEQKYEKLRSLLLLFELRLEHGAANWCNFSELDQNRYVGKKKLQRKRMQAVGNIDVAVLYPNCHKKINNLKSLIGDDKAECFRRILSYGEQEQQLAFQGRNFHDINKDENKEPGLETNTNILTDLSNRFYCEQDHVINEMRNEINRPYDNSSMCSVDSEMTNLYTLVLLRAECQRVTIESDFEIGCLSVGLFERVMEDEGKRNETDSERVLKLAKLRIEQRNVRIQVNHPHIEQENDDTPPEKDDLASWMLAYIREMTKKHVEERECLLSIILDSEFSEICELTMSSTDNENKTRLLELENLRDELSLQLESHRDKNMTYIDEAAAIQFALRQVNFDDAENIFENCSLLLRDLQNQQSHEISIAIGKIKVMCEVDLKVMRRYEIDERNWKTNSGVMKVLCIHADSITDNTLLDALDAKYDELRDKLLAEALIAKFSEEEWRRMTEKERQQQLMKLKLEEQRLRKLDEISKLLGDGLINDERLRSLMGQNKAEAEKRMREKLALRKQRREAGMTEEQIESLEKEEDDIFENRRNVLQDLQHSYDEERAALLRTLHSQQNHLLAERERQMKLTMLKRDARQLNQENTLENAALLMDLSKKHGQSIEENRLHQEKLARARLQERLANRKKPEVVSLSLSSEHIPTSLSEWQNRITEIVESTHKRDVEMLFKIFEDNETSKKVDSLADEKTEDLLLKIDESTADYELWCKCPSNIEPQTNEEILLNATAIRIQLISRNDSSYTLDDVKVAIITDLQILHENEISQLINHLTDKTMDDLKNISESEMHHYENNEFTSLWKTILKQEDLIEINRDDTLTEALHQKYDAIKDKLLMEVLISQAGEAEWARLSERERQTRLVTLKREERRLKREGKMDEVEALFADLNKQEQLLQNQLGDTKAEAEKHLKQRLEIRRRILAEREDQGLSCDDSLIDELVSEEHEQLLVEEKKKKRNILADLDKHFDDERDALLRELNNYDSRIESERRRQLEIAKLKRQGKQLEQENRFNSAILLIQNAKNQNQQFENKMSIERERQLAIAREKIEGRRRKKNEIVDEVTNDSNLKELQSIYENKMKEGDTLQDVLLELMEAQYTMESEVLLKLIAKSQKEESCLNLIINTPHESIQEALVNLKNIYDEWLIKQNKEIQPIRCLVSDNNNKKSKIYFSRAAKLRSDMEELLLESVALKLQDEKLELYKNNANLSDEELDKEATVRLLVSLQEQQQIRTQMKHELIAESDNAHLRELLSHEFNLTTERWLNNLASLLHESQSPDSLEDVGDDTIYEQEKIALIEKAKLGADIDVDAEMGRLLNEHELRIKMKEGSLSEQRLKLNQRIQKERLKREQKMDDSQIAASMMANAKRDQDNYAARIQGDKTTRKELMNERLKERREKKRLQMEREQEVREQEAAASRENTELSLKDDPFSAFKREKTVLNVELSDSMKEEVFQQLIAQQTTLNTRLSQEQKRRESELKKRLDKMKLRRSSEAAGVIQNAERQRSNLEKAATEDRERNINKTKERVERLRYEKTKTLMHIKTHDIDDNDDVDGNNSNAKDERESTPEDGAKKAEYIQQKLKIQEKLDEPKPNINLDQNDAIKKLRQRKKNKKA